MNKEDGINREREAYEVYAPEDLVNTYKAFSSELNIDPKTIYYPSCSIDVSPSVAFPNSEVCYVDIDSEAVQALRANGYDAHESNAQTFVTPKKVDLLILLNPVIPAIWPVRQIKEGGYVLCNNYHGTADEVSENEEFNLISIISKDIDRPDQIVTGENMSRMWSGNHRADDFYIFQRVKPVQISDEAALAIFLEKEAMKEKAALKYLAKRPESVNMEDI